jgi:exodeoxyribonuclease V alpha subunit
MEDSRQREEHVELSGLIVDQIFSNTENGYGVFRLEPDGQGRLVTVCGDLGHVVPGEHIKARGKWKAHPRFGDQFLVDHYKPCLPSSREGLIRFLGSGLIEGVGPNLATRIVEHFGEATLQVLSDQSFRLKEVKGCGPKKRAAIIVFWKERQQSKDFLLFLNEQGIGLAQAMKIQKVYGDQSLEVLKHHPYRMIQDVPGFGFQVVDRLALRMGMELHSPERAGAAVSFLLTEASKEGHCHLLKEEVVLKAMSLLKVTIEVVQSGIDEMLRESQLIWVGDVLMLPHLYRLESSVCDGIQKRLSIGAPAPLDRRRLAMVLERVKISLAPSQMEAVGMALENPFCIITGGPGVGKTTIVKVIVNYWESMGFEPILAAPTGRASQRMEEATSRKATTLHRLMKFQPGVGFLHQRNFPLEGVVFVVDEFSMVDLELFHAFLEALPNKAHLIMVGDRDQLPSVGAGRVLGDLMESGVIPVTVLKTVFRQEGNSLLVHNSHRLIKGEVPHLAEKSDALKDFYFIESDQPEHTLKVIQKLLLERIPQRFGEASVGRVQVLSPMKKGPLGTAELNVQLQGWLNPNGRILLEDGRGELRQGDRVVQLVNNYDLDLFNGDLGVVSGGDAQYVSIEFDGREVSYEAEALRDISLAYAMTVHKSQGSEYPWVVMPIYRGHRMMLSLELLYTALTRARKMCVWVGSWELLCEVLDSPPQLERKTLLKAMLMAKMQSE